MTKPIRILQLITDLEQAGAERVVCQLAEGLAGRGHHVHVAALWRSAQEPGDLAAGLAEAGVPVSRLDVQSKWDLPKLWQLVGLVRRERFDIVHTHLWHADLAGRAVRAILGRPPVIGTIHTAERRPMPWRFLADRLTRRLCARVVCVSASVRDHHASLARLPAEGYEIIANAVDLAWLADRPGRKEARAGLDLPSDVPVVGTVARLEPEKNLPLLVRAFERLRGTFPEAQLLLAGTGREEASLRAQIAERGLEASVRMLGFQRDVRPVLAAIDAFVLPSRWEGFGLATAEAMACGLPAVVTDVPGSRDLIRHGRTGWVVADDDDEGMAGALVEALGDAVESSRRGSAAAADAKARFDSKKMLDHYETVYERVLSGPI